MSNVTIKKEEGRVSKNPSYLNDLIEKWGYWTNMEDEAIEEAMKDLSGDLWSEIRKFEAQTYGFLENIEELNAKITVAVEDKLTGEVTKEEIDITTHVKNFIKERVKEMWKDIIQHQKVGVDKLALITRKHLDKK